MFMQLMHFLEIPALQHKLIIHRPKTIVNMKQSPKGKKELALFFTQAPFNINH